MGQFCVFFEKSMFFWKMGHFCIFLCFFNLLKIFSIKNIWLKCFENIWFKCFENIFIFPNCPKCVSEWLSEWLTEWRRLAISRVVCTTKNKIQVQIVSHELGLFRNDTDKIDKSKIEILLALDSTSRSWRFILFAVWKSPYNFKQKF